MEDAQEEEEVENNAREADDVEGKDKRVQEAKVCNKYCNIDYQDQTVRGDEDQSWSQETWPSVLNTKDENAGNTHRGKGPQNECSSWYLQARDFLITW